MQTDDQKEKDHLINRRRTSCPLLLKGLAGELSFQSLAKHGFGLLSFVLTFVLTLLTLSILSATLSEIVSTMTIDGFAVQRTGFLIKQTRE
jgi:hypothetical protein